MVASVPVFLGCLLFVTVKCVPVDRMFINERDSNDNDSPTLPSAQSLATMAQPPDYPDIPAPPRHIASGFQVPQFGTGDQQEAPQPPPLQNIPALQSQNPQSGTFFQPPSDLNFNPWGDGGFPSHQPPPSIDLPQNPNWLPGTNFGPTNDARNYLFSDARAFRF